MTNPFPVGPIKRVKKLSVMGEFDLILQGISGNDKIGHLFIVDTELDHKNATKKQLFFNEIFTLIFEKKEVLSPNERSVFQLLDAMRLSEKGIINSYKTTEKNQC